MKAIDKFYIVAERYNPQIGTYLSDVYVGKKRNNKDSISCQFDYYGSKKTLKFSIGTIIDRINLCNEYHYCFNPGNCVYGNMNYYGFDTCDKAKAYLESQWPKHYNYEKCMKKLSA